MKKKCRRLERVRYAILAVIFVYILILFLTNDTTSSVAFDKIEKAVLDAQGLERMDPGTERELKKFYGLNKKDYENVCFYHDTEAMAVDTILLLRTKDEKKMEAVSKAAEERITTLKQNFDGYGEKQMKLLEDAVIIKKGDLFLLAVSPDAAEIKKAFLESI